MLTIRRSGRTVTPVALRCLAAMTLPPEPSELARCVQTLRWAFRPLAFMRGLPARSYGDSFSVNFLGFERPMVLISDPAAIKALYTEREHGLPPGRNIVLEPILGSRSLLLLEGAEHLARRKLMLPAFHGERMRSYEPIVDEIVDAEIDSWPLGERVPDPPADAGGDAGGDPAGRLRRRRRAAAGAAARACSRRCCRRPPRRSPSCSAWRRGASAAAGPGRASRAS